MPAASRATASTPNTRLPSCRSRTASTLAYTSAPASSAWGSTTFSAFCFASYAHPSSQKPLCWHPTRLCQRVAPFQPSASHPLAENVVVGVLHRDRDLGHAEVALDGLERGPHFVGAGAHDPHAGPLVEDGVRRALAQVRVVHRATADTPALQDPDGHVLGGATSRFLEQAGQHVVLPLVEVARGGPFALLDRHDLRARASELPQRDRSPGARTHDDGVDVEPHVRNEVTPAHDLPGHGEAHPPAGRPTSGPSYPTMRHVRGSR